ncbi:hypothetical protein [Paraburkholderia tropica]|uniref:hypothetical protein n=1 Tax=Paraburkholderia tropica TaxID=92647 RepID=UPI0007EC43B8|nr:hypothetical protein [Paraburkholderia tropica]OBR53161.1 hypothetical protein A6456_09370 [Paraburkholderia tropica]
MRLGEVVDGVFKPDKAPKTSKLREEWSTRQVKELMDAGRLVHGGERGIPDEIAFSSFPEGADLELDNRRKLVKYVLEHWGASIFEDRTSYARAIENAVDIFGVSAPTARGWVETHLFYGRHPNALIKQNWNKGAKGIPRRGRIADAVCSVFRRVGRPTANERTERQTIHKTKPIGKRFFDALKRFVRGQAWSNDDGASEVADRFKDTQVGCNRAPDGSKQYFPKDPKYFPEDEYLRSIVRRLLKVARSERDRERERTRQKWRGMSRSGSAQDLVHEELSVLDIDGTPADVRLRFGNDEVYIDGQGKPTVLLAIDRGSDAVVGWHVTFGTEKGAGYTSCVFSAYTPKERELHRWGLPTLAGMVYGCASEIFIDRGPGMSKATQDAIVKRLRTNSLLAAPGDPQGKGHAEGVMGYFQKELSRLPGSTHGTGNPDKDRNRRLNVKKDAVLTLRHFMQALLTAINKWNLSADVRHLLTPRMVEAETLPVPCEIYNFNKGRRRGDYAWNWPEEKIFRTLCNSQKLAAPDGHVRLENRTYTSLDFQAFARHAQRMNNDVPVEVLIFEIPSAPLHLFWERPDKSLGLLDATSRTARQYDDDFRWTHDFLSMRRSALKREARYKHRKQPVVRKVVNSDAVSLAKQKQIAAAEKHARSAMAPRTAAENRREATAVAEREYADSLADRFGKSDRKSAARQATQAPQFYDAADDEQVLFTDF